MPEITEPISIRVPASLKAQAEQVARADGRTVAGLMRKLLLDFLNQQSVTDSPQPRKRTK